MLTHIGGVGGEKREGECVLALSLFGRGKKKGQTHSWGWIFREKWVLQLSVFLVKNQT